MTKLPLNFELDRYGIHCRLVNEADAEFIVALRSNPKLGRFIHASDGDVLKQKEWIHNYKQREQNDLEYYFIYFFDDQPFALNRIYNRTEDSCTTGSWVVTPGMDTKYVLASLFIERDICFEMLQYSKIQIDVRIKNTKVWKLHKQLGAEQYDEDELNYYFIIPKEKYQLKRNQYLKIFNL